jgi:hypothetical protein
MIRHTVAVVRNARPSHDIGARCQPSGLGRLLLLSLVVSTGLACRVATAERSCDQIVDRLYRARASGNAAAVRTLLSAGIANPSNLEDFAAVILARDSKLGPPGNRNRFLKLTGDHDNSQTGHYYSVRLGFRVQFASGELSEIIECRVDESGEHAAIDRIELSE